jgi:hypothetical protein
VWGVTGGDDALLGSVTWTASVPQGTQSESLPIELTGVPTPLYDVYVAVDGGDESARGIIDECYEENNVTRWGAYVCL